MIQIDQTLTYDESTGWNELWSIIETHTETHITRKQTVYDGLTAPGNMSFTYNAAIGRSEL